MPTQPQKKVYKYNRRLVSIDGDLHTFVDTQTAGKKDTIGRWVDRAIREKMSKDKLTLKTNQHEQRKKKSARSSRQ
jgi:hypothetical protein